MTDSPVVLITGASSGIGAATAELLSRHGYRLVLAARRIDRLQTLVDEIESRGGQAQAVPTDVAVLAEIQDLVEQSLARFGQIDVLINNAGFGRLDWLENLDPIKDIESQIRVNLLGVIQTSRVVLPHMISRRKGHIINMASVAGLVATPTYSVYAASKFAIRGFSEALRREVGVWGIHVTTVFPGTVNTEFKVHTGARRKTGLMTPALLRLEAEDIARKLLDVIRKPRPTLLMPGVLRLGVLVNALAPSLVDQVMERRFVRPERGL